MASHMLGKLSTTELLPSSSQPKSPDLDSDFDGLRDFSNYICQKYT
jgi:hypothetical protein